ncbi:SNARE domain containing protein [Pseudohyphozyma bogoriensis]|nr:SNARE domain containing protein [Pseudohyphozyma bogoriensis]
MSAAKLSSLSTRTLSQILELTRSVQESIPSSPSLPTQISKNLSALAAGIEVLRAGGEGDSGVVEGLEHQYERLVGLVEGLGVVVEKKSLGGKKGKGRTGRLVETDDDGELEDEDEEREGEDEDGSGLSLKSLSPHVAVPMPTTDPERDLAQMEADEDSMRRANSEVLQMQQQMMDDQDDTLNHLSSAIARQHQLSLHISTELEMQEGLLDDTEAAIDRTQGNLRRASTRLDRFSRKAKETGSTGLIVALVVVLLVLIIIFKT